MAFVGKIVKSAVNIKDKFLIGSIKDVYASQRNTLKKNLEKAAGTAFGKAYQFDRILKSGDIIDQFPGDGAHPDISYTHRHKKRRRTRFLF